MRIIPVAGHDIGFTRKGWGSVGRAVGAQSSPATDSYFESLDALAATSSREGKVEAEGTSEVVRSPGSPWGGKEVPTGMDYRIDAELVLEGDVDVRWQPDDEAAKAAIANDFSEWAKENNVAVSDAIEDLKSRVFGEEREVEVSAKVSSLARNPDGTARVSLSVSVAVSGHESEGERRSRIEDARADHEYDRRKDDGP